VETDFSVIISSNGRPGSLVSTLDGLRELDHPCFEVLVVVGPDAAGYDAVRRAAPRETVWMSVDRRNVSHARNVALPHARGRIAAFIDDDAVPDPAWLTDLAATFGPVDVGAAGGPVYDHTGVSYQLFRSVVSRSGVPRLLPERAPDPSAALSSPETWLVPNLIGTNMCARSELLRHIGGFDEAFPYYLEDSDIAVRVCDTGHRVSLLGRGIVHHGSHGSPIRGTDRVVTDWSRILHGHYLFAHIHGVPTGRVARTWEDVGARLGDIRNLVAHEVATGLRPERAMRELEEINERVARAAAWRTARRGKPRPIRACGHGPVRRYPSWGRHSAGSARRQVALISGASNAQVSSACAIGRETVRERGHIVRVIQMGARRHHVRFDAGVWVHELPLADRQDPSGALQDELRRVGAGRPIDCWAPVDAWARAALGRVSVVDVPRVSADEALA
jgi:GT2 family glycosyltransferase